MAVHCVFFTPGDKDSCQVLRLMGVGSPAARQTRQRLAQRYCRCGHFISCPIFNRVERGLDELNQARELADLPLAAP